MDQARLNLDATDKDVEVGLLIFGFNRPKELENVLNHVPEWFPGKISIFLDGPRSGNRVDKVGCRKSMEVAKNFCKDREGCEVISSRTNLGLTRSIVGGISASLEHHQKVIVLEDDCLPNDDFFRFTLASLRAFEDDNSVGMVQGTTWRTPFTISTDTYYRSRYHKIWGWATWRDRWQGYEDLLAGWDSNFAKAVARSWMRNPLKRIQFVAAIDALEELDTWDYQWVVHLMNNQQTSVAPSCNLVTNVGFGSLATHTKETFFHVRGQRKNLDSSSLVLSKWPSWVIDGIGVTLEVMSILFSLPRLAIRKLPWRPGR